MNSSGQFESQSEVAKVLKGLLFSGMTLSTIGGNSLSLLALFVTKKWHTKYLIVSLAITDLLLGCLVMPIATISAVKHRWIFEHGWCDLQGCLGFLLCAVSIMTITCVSIERYVLFTYPSVHFKMVQTGTKFMQWLVIGTWVYGGMWTFLAWQVPHFSYANELLNCAVRWRYSYYFTLTCGAITSCLPMSIILFCNFKVTLKIRKQIKRLGTTRKRSDSDILKRKLAEVRISRMLLVVTIAFLLCWTPYSVSGICYLMPNCSWPDEYFTACVFFCLFNSCINPILYGTFDRRFRKAMRYVFWKVFRYTSASKIGRMAAVNIALD